MSKQILATALTAVALSLAGCGGAEENNVATENFEDLNAVEDVNMDMNMDVNMDMNVADNAVDNTSNNATGNEAIDNTANSY